MKSIEKVFVILGSLVLVFALVFFNLSRYSPENANKILDFMHLGTYKLYDNTILKEETVSLPLENEDFRFNSHRLRFINSYVNVNDSNIENFTTVHTKFFKWLDKPQVFKTQEGKDISIYSQREGTKYGYPFLPVPKSMTEVSLYAFKKETNIKINTLHSEHYIKLTKTNLRTLALTAEDDKLFIDLSELKTPIRDFNCECQRSEIDLILPKNAIFEIGYIKDEDNTFDERGITTAISVNGNEIDKSKLPRLLPFAPGKIIINLNPYSGNLRIKN